MDFFSGKTPDLVGPTMKTILADMMNKPKISNSTISEKITHILSNFYSEYIYEYIFIILIIILIVVCLCYRYYDKKNKEKNKDTNKEFFSPHNLKKKNKINSDLIEEIKNFDFDDIDDRAVSPPGGYIYMNPTDSIANQNNELNVMYPPDTLPVNIGNEKIFTRNLYENPIADEPLNAPDYDYDNVYKNRSRSYYSGAYDTYKNAKDTTIENPYGWSNNFNTTTGNFVKQMTDQNLQSVIDYHTIADNTELNLVKGASGNGERYALEFEKPYDE